MYFQTFARVSRHAGPPPWRGISGVSAVKYIIIDPGTTGVLNIASIAARREGETHR